SRCELKNASVPTRRPPTRNLSKSMNADSISPVVLAFKIWICRLIAGYGELEYLLSVCVGRSLASGRNRPSSRSRLAHRSKYENLGTKMIFRVRGEKKRIDAASRLMRQSYAKAGMISEFDETMNAMRACMNIRNLFAHCHWARSKKRGLFFIKP